MERLAGRITRSYDDLAAFFARLADVSDMLAVYEHHHKNKRTHCHFYLEGLKVKSTDTLKNWIKKCLNTETFEPSDWEFAEKISKGVKKGQPVDRDALIYFHKAIYEIKFNKGFTQDFIEEQHKKSYNPENVTTIKKYVVTHESPKERKKRQYDLLQDMKKKYGELNDYFDYEKAVRCVINVHRENQLLISEYKVKEYVMSMMDDGALVRRLTQFCQPRV